MKREKTITFRVNDLEDERIKAMAHKRGKSVAEYLRWLVDRDEDGPRGVAAEITDSVELVNDALRKAVERVRGSQEG
jgi:hypothetical protein